MQPQPNYGPQADVEEPPVQPQGNPVYLYSAAPTPPVKEAKKSPLIPIIIGIILVPVALDAVAGMLADKRPSGVVYEGRSISQGEAKATVKDISNLANQEKTILAKESRQASAAAAKPAHVAPSEQKKTVDDLVNVTKGVRADDPSSLSSAPAQTEIGRRFQGILQKVQADTLAYQHATAEAHSPEFMSPSQLGTPDGRDTARQIFNDYIRATNLYRGQMSDLTNQIAEFSKELAGSVPPNLVEHNEEEIEIAKLDNAQVETIGNILDFVDSAKPGYDSSSNRLIFSNDQDVSTYNQLKDQLAQRQQALEQRRAEILQARQRSIDQAAARLQQDAQQP